MHAPWTSDTHAADEMDCPHESLLAVTPLCARLIYRSYNALKPACKALLRHGALYAREKTERDPEHFRTCENDA